MWMISCCAIHDNLELNAINEPKSKTINEIKNNVSKPSYS